MADIWQLARDLLTEIADFTVHHNAIICNATMSFCRIDVIWQLALDLLTEMAENTAQHNTIIRTATMSLGGWHLAACTGPSH